MVGRAGRYGLNGSNIAQSILITYMNKAKTISLSSLSQITSCFDQKKRSLHRCMMEAIGINLAVTDTQLLIFLKTTLFWQQRPAVEN